MKAENFIDYYRGGSTSVRADLKIKYKNADYTVKDVYYYDASFTGEPISVVDGVDRFVKWMTEPYYGIRWLYYFYRHPNIAIGLNFIHFKIFADPDQYVKREGTDETGATIDDNAPAVRFGDLFDGFNVSHGINHLALLFAYRFMLFKSGKLPYGRLQPYFGTGAGPCIPHVEVIFAGQDKAAYEYQLGWGNWSFELFLGTRVMLARYFNLFLEYRLTYTILYGMRLKHDGKAKVQFAVNHFTIGLSFNFGGMKQASQSYMKRENEKGIKETKDENDEVKSKGE